MREDFKEILKGRIKITFEGDIKEPLEIIIGYRDDLKSWFHYIFNNVDYLQEILKIDK